MCGRYFLTAPGDLLAKTLELAVEPALAPRWNIAPTQEVAIVRTSEAGGRELVPARWGLIPHWAKEAAIGNKLINARGETLAEKPSFRDSFRKRRCLIPASGYYEWQKVAQGKQPWAFGPEGGGLFALAGLWSHWRDRESGAEVESCAIVTTSPNALAATVHDRMPVILEEPARTLWLDPTPRPDAELSALLGPCPTGLMAAWPVSTWVNSPAHDDPRCLEPLGPAV